MLSNVELNVILVIEEIVVGRLRLKKNRLFHEQL